MKIGFYATGAASASYKSLLEQVEYAEDVGFDSVWLRERHFHTDDQGRNFFSSPFVRFIHRGAHEAHPHRHGRPHPSTDHPSTLRKTRQRSM